MNCDQAHRFMLLDESSELSRPESRRLADHLEQCGECRQYRADMLAVIEAARSEPVKQTPSAPVLSAIRAAAERELKRKVIAFPQPIIALTACAASIAIGAAIWLGFPSNTRPATQAAELHTILALVSDYDAAELTETEQAAGTGELQLRILAERLMDIETAGMEDEDPFEFLSLPVVPPPTASRSHRMTEPLPTICV